MFRKCLSFMLALMLALSCMTALASGKPAMESYNGSESYYIASNGYIYSVSGVKKTTLQAESILYVGQKGICYISVNSYGIRRLVYEATGKKPTVFASSIDCAAYSEAAGLVYYTTTSDKKTVYRCSPEYGVSARACVAENNVVSLLGSIQGLVMVTRDTKGSELSWLLKTGAASPEITSIDNEYYFGGCALQVMHNGSMKLVFAGMDDYSLNVDSSPVACTMEGNTLYYTKYVTWNRTTQLRKYTTDTASRTVLARFNGMMSAMIAADEMYVYLLSENGLLYAVNTETGESVVCEDIGGSPESPRMVMCGNILYLYDAPERKIPTLIIAYELNEEEDFVFVDPVIVPSVTVKPTPTPRPTPVPTPTPMPEIKSGSRGDDVKKAQNALISLGYLASGQADGVVGSRTLRAIRLFQEAIGVTENGILTQDQLKKLYSSSAPVCDLYKPLSVGAVGTRVSDLQKQLQDHGYIAYNPDSAYGANTKAAVQRLQEELGYYQSGNMTRALMQYVYNGKMPDYSGYIPLSSGCSGIRVKELQQRLKYLGYYTGTVNGSYNAATAAAVKLFEANYSSVTTGKATISLLKKLFSSSAPHYVPPVTPDPTPKPTPKPTAKPTPKPTKLPTFAPDEYEINSNSSYAEIWALQTKLYELGYITEGDRTGRYNSATKNAIGGIQTEMRRNGIEVKVSGHATQTTLDYIDSLYYDVTPEPTAKPTSAPSGDSVIGPDSPYSDVWPLQSKLNEMGLLEDKYVTGTYNSGTKNAIGAIQKTMAQNGYMVTINGRAGKMTQDYIDQMYEEYLDNLPGLQSSGASQNKNITSGDLNQLAKLFNNYLKTSGLKHAAYKTDTAVQQLKEILKTWGWYDAKYTCDTVYDDDLFSNIGQIRTLLGGSDPMLEVFSEADAGKVDDILFDYIIQMFENDPATLDPGSYLQSVNLK